MTTLSIYSAHFTDNHSENYPDIDINNLNFTEGFIETCWYNSDHIFRVYICMDNNNCISTKIRRLCCFIKPIEKYQVCEFETLFGFSSNCENYDENKIVAVEYYKSYNNDGIYIY